MLKQGSKKLHIKIGMKVREVIPIGTKKQTPDLVLLPNVPIISNYEAVKQKEIG